MCYCAARYERRRLSMLLGGAPHLGWTSDGLAHATVRSCTKLYEAYGPSPACGVLSLRVECPTVTPSVFPKPPQSTTPNNAPPMYAEFWSRALSVRGGSCEEEASPPPPTHPLTPAPPTASHLIPHLVLFAVHDRTIAWTTHPSLTCAAPSDCWSGSSFPM